MEILPLHALSLIKFYLLFYRSSDSVSPIEGDGVEVIPEDEDSVSVEDSYTSASETTLTVTHIDPAMLKSTSSLDTSFTEAMSPRDVSFIFSKFSAMFIYLVLSYCNTIEQKTC